MTSDSSDQMSAMTSGNSDHQHDQPWYWTLGMWALIGAALLYFGGLAAHGLKALLEGPDALPCTLPEAARLGCSFSQSLLTFAVGGGLTFGLAVFAWRGISWALGVAIVAVVLVAVFVWPTPYKYEWAKDKSFVVRIHRFTGDIHYEMSPPSPVPQSTTRR
jgi:heme/copper-type cytochrome/quinol oxidase subunit 3